MGLSLTSSFLLEYSSEYLNEYSSTWGTVIQAANDEERVVGQHTCGPKGQDLEQAPTLNVYIQIYFQADKLQMKLRSPTFT